jgi:hypothetical protein
MEVLGAAGAIGAPASSTNDGRGDIAIEQIVAIEAGRKWTARRPHDEAAILTRPRPRRTTHVDTLEGGVSMTL